MKLILLINLNLPFLVSLLDKLLNLWILINYILYNLPIDSRLDHISFVFSCEFTDLLLVILDVDSLNL